MPLELVEDAPGDPRNAKALAVASDLAYLPEAEAIEAYRTQLGLEARLISCDNTQAYVATNDKNIVVAFRGTESPTSLDGLKDVLLTDAVDLLIVPEGQIGTDFAAAGVGARFHLGFMTALAKIWDTLAPVVAEELKKEDRPLWLTGHSLGGALALLAGWRFHRQFVSVHQIYTFGAPMVGNLEATKAFDRELAGKIFRYVNSNDPVPKLPTISLVANDYGHCLQEVPLDELGGGSVLEMLKQVASKTVDGILNATIMDELWQQVMQRLGAHAIANYRTLLDTRFKDNA